MARRTRLASLSAPHFRSAEVARELIETTRWPKGPVCPHCGSADRVYDLVGKRTRPGLRKCRACRRQFTVTIGTIFERSKVPLNKWLAAIQLLFFSGRVVSIYQIRSRLGMTYKTAWRMTYQILGSLGYKSKDGYPAHLIGQWGRIGDGFDWHYLATMMQALGLTCSEASLKDVLEKVLGVSRS
jgi:transposase-like protein